MNKSYVILFLMCAVEISHASEQKAVVPALPTWNVFHQQLRTDYENYLTARLEEYKKADVNMDELIAMGSVITGGHCPQKLFRTVDAQGNRFIHIAIDKEDLQTAQWLYDNSKELNQMSLNNENKNPLDLCVQKLFSPSMTYDNACELLYASIKYIGKSDNYSFQKKCLQKIATAQLQLKQAEFELVLPVDIISCLVPRINKDTPQSFLSDIYKEISDPVSGDTFTHVLVRKELTDDLYEWIKQERVSFKTNSDGLTPLDIAVEKYREFTKNVALIDGDKSTFEKRKCCLFMLLNYCKIKTGTSANAYFQDCCDKHKITQ